MGIEQGAKAVDEGDGPDAGVWSGTRAALAQALLHRGEEHVQGRVWTPGSLCRIRDEKIMAALGAAGAGKTMGKDAAFEVAAEFSFGVPAFVYGICG